MVKKVSDLQGEDLKAWQDTYEERQKLRRKYGRPLRAEFREAAKLPPEQREQTMAEIAQRAMKKGVVAKGVGDILVQEFRRAATANRDESGANLDVSKRDIDPAQINTPEEIEAWGFLYRLHPDVREDYLSEMKKGPRKMFVLVDSEGEPAGRGFLIYPGPAPHRSEKFPEPENLVGKPAEEQVIEEIGASPYVEGLYTFEGYRQSGVGIRLMKEIEEEVRVSDEMPKRVALGVRPDNDAARLMYKNRLHYDYRTVAGENTFVAHMTGLEPHELLLMVKDLSRAE